MLHKPANYFYISFSPTISKIPSLFGVSGVLYSRDKSAPQYVCPISGPLPNVIGVQRPSLYRTQFYFAHFQQIPSRNDTPNPHYITHLVLRLLPPFSFFGSVSSGPSVICVDPSPPETLNCNILRQPASFVLSFLTFSCSIYSGLWARCCCCRCYCCAATCLCWLQCLLRLSLLAASLSLCGVVVVVICEFCT